MPIKIICPACDEEFQVRDAAAGKKLRCRVCGEGISVPDSQSKSSTEEVDDDLPSIQESKPRPKSAAARRIALKTRDRELNETIAGMSPPTAIAIFLGGGVLCAIIVGVLVLWNGNFRDGNRQPGIIAPAAPMAGPAVNPGALNGGQFNDATNTVFPVAQIRLPEFVDQRVPLRSPKSGTTYYEVQATSNGGNSFPGSDMKMRLYLPVERAGAQTLACVLVGPAGSNLLSGKPLDDVDHEDETIPYVKAGFAVVHFSLDGPLDDLENASDLEMSAAYQKFSTAFAGLVNARNAMAFVLTRVPEVDPKRIYIAGHSSAGTLALLFAEHEPSLAGSIAYAPACNVDQRLSSAVNHPSIQTLMPGAATFVKRSSPQTHVGTLYCPVFLFHGRGDTVVTVAQSDHYVATAKALGKRIEYSQVPDAHHYTAMASQGVPLAIAWLKRQSGNAVSATSAPASAGQTKAPEVPANAPGQRNPPGVFTPGPPNPLPDLRPPPPFPKPGE